MKKSTASSPLGGGDLYGYTSRLYCAVVTPTRADPPPETSLSSARPWPATQRGCATRPAQVVRRRSFGRRPKRCLSRRTPRLETPRSRLEGSPRGPPFGDRARDHARDHARRRAEDAGEIVRMHWREREKPWRFSQQGRPRARRRLQGLGHLGGGRHHDRALRQQRMRTARAAIEPGAGQRDERRARVDLREQPGIVRLATRDEACAHLFERLDFRFDGVGGRRNQASLRYVRQCIERGVGAIEPRDEAMKGERTDAGRAREARSRNTLTAGERASPRRGHSAVGAVIPPWARGPVVQRLSSSRRSSALSP